MRSSSSHRAPMRPPRFMVPNASLPSSAPRRASSSITSGLPSTPSTPGWASETSRPRTAPAVGHGEGVLAHAEHAPRRVVGGDDEQAPVGGQQRPPRPRPSGVRPRPRAVWPAARAARPSGHRRAASATSPAQGLDLVERSACRRRTSAGRRRWRPRRCRTERTPRGPSRTAARGTARRRTRRPRRGRTRRRPGTAARCSRRPSAVATSTPSPPSFTIAAVEPAGQQAVGGLVGVGGPDGDLALRPVADGQRGVAERVVELARARRPARPRAAGASRGRATRVTGAVPILQQLVDRGPAWLGRERSRPAPTGPAPGERPRGRCRRARGSGRAPSARGRR